MTQPDKSADSAASGGVIGWAKRVWSLLWKPTSQFSLGVLLIGGAVAGVVFWGGFNWALEITNTETFCVSCHEMAQNVYREYKGTVHDTNKSGVRATCPDCHVPREWVHKMIRKVQASNELYHKALGTIDTREKFEAKRLELATHVWEAMKKTDSRECRNCHNFDAMDVSQQRPRSRNRHLQAMDEGKTCIDCHKGIAHKLPAGAFNAERELEETWNSRK